MEGVNQTVSGQDIDLIFGYQSVSDRIVDSVMIQGTSNTLLKHFTKEVVELYRQHKGKKA